MSVGQRLPQARIAAAFLAGAVISGAVVALRLAGGLEALELAVYDAFVRLQPAPASPGPPVTIVSMSDEEIVESGQWGLTDRKLARALRAILSAEPRAIGVDLFRDLPVAPGSEELEAVFKEDPRIVMVSKFGPDPVPPPPALAGTERVGFNDVVVDPGGVVRRGLLFLDDGTTFSVSLALRLALLYLRPLGISPAPAPDNPGCIKLGAAVMPPLESGDGPYESADARGYQFLLDFSDPEDRIPVVSLAAVLRGTPDPGALRDRVVLVGTMAQTVKDFFYTPRSRGVRSRQEVFGVVLHAQIASQLIRLALGRSVPLGLPSQVQEIAWIVFWGLLGGAAGLWARTPLRFAANGLAGTLGLSVAAFGAFVFRWWVPLVPPVLAWLLSAGLVTAYVSKQERRERLQLLQLFSKHVSPEVAALIWNEREQIFSGGRPRSRELVATVLFSDLRGFTNVSETLPPAKLVEWLNEYMESMTQLVMKHGGVVDDYAGDGIKANFGVPIPRSDVAAIRQDAANAVSCAAAMEPEMERLNRRWQDRSLPPAAIRVGICTGPVVAGAVGSRERLKYTTIGDTVNVAARLEALDRSVAAAALCRILMSESTAELLEGYPMERLGEFPLKGRNQRVAVFQVLTSRETRILDRQMEVIS